MELRTLQSEMIAAMKSGDKARKNVISGLIAAIKKAAIDEGTRDDIQASLVDRVILKELKSAREQIDTCPKERAELYAEYTYNYRVIEEFAPKMLSEAEIREILTSKYPDVLETKNKGLIMRAVMPELKGKADGALISEVVASFCR